MTVLIEQRMPSRMRLIKNQSTTSFSSSSTTNDKPAEIIAIGLGDRMVISEMAEVWTLKGVMRDGMVVPEPVGELSFVMIPGNYQPSTAVVGYVAPQKPFELGIGEDLIWPQIRGMIAQLGYDLDGFYVSLSLCGKPFYRKEFCETKQ